MNEVFQLVFPDREVSRELKVLVFTIASQASGCMHCQSHGAFHLNKLGVSDEKFGRCGVSNDLTCSPTQNVPH